MLKKKIPIPTVPPFSFFGIPAACEKTGEKETVRLQYREDGKFRIMQISDIQDYFPMKAVTKRVLKKALDTYPVDLIVLTGDNIGSTTRLKFYAALCINEFMSLFEIKHIRCRSMKNTSALSAAREKISGRKTSVHTICRSIPLPIPIKWFPISG